MAGLEVVKNMKESLSNRRAVSASREIELTCSAPKAKKVCVAGQFNNWNMTMMPMKKGNDGTWRIKLKLAPGKYEYKFIVDGTWAQETSSAETAANTFGTYNNVMTV
jgi:1,4-alpha-glucan branching enzyme